MVTYFKNSIVLISRIFFPHASIFCATKTCKFCLDPIPSAGTWRSFLLQAPHTNAVQRKPLWTPASVLCWFPDKGVAAWKTGPFLTQIKEWRSGFIRHRGSFTLGSGFSIPVQPFLLSWQGTTAALPLMGRTAERCSSSQGFLEESEYNLEFLMFCPWLGAHHSGEHHLSLTKGPVCSPNMGSQCICLSWSE